MDAGEDADLSLQRTAGDSLNELKTYIPLLFYKPAISGTAGKKFSNQKVRPLVRKDGLKRVLDLLSPFQELPQLLDPVLEEFMRPLSAVLIGRIREAKDQKPHVKSLDPSLAVCQIVSTLCRIRGAKVVVRFLSNEAKHLEPLIEALEERVRSVETRTDADLPAWEERYVLLLWLSHLVLTPFPISSTVRSQGQGDALHRTDELKLGKGHEAVSRICFIALSQLSSPSRERDAAVLVLVHLTIRPDMKEAKLLESLLALILKRLDPGATQAETSLASSKTHENIGVLALLAGIFRAVDAISLAPHIKNTVRFVLESMHTANSDADNMASSAVTRKLMTKILRCATVGALALSSIDSLQDQSWSEIIEEILEEVIEQLLMFLSDGDTPVRHAASKALSVIALKLGLDMRGEIIEAVIASLDESVLWMNEQNPEGGVPSGLTAARDLSLVNPLRWQGLMLTLSQLLFRRAPSLDVLPSIINALLLGLSFEQRNSTGISNGGPVRDAANFGIWALARQYSTEELVAVQMASIRSLGSVAANVTILQTLACELVCAACLDPSGNIRRGSSAALQELIGRHPDTITEGISIVQTVDYHAVALRSAALIKVAVAAGRLASIYRDSLLSAALGWRGILSPDADSRRWSAESIGQLIGADQQLATQTLSTLRIQFQQLQLRDVEARHGVLMTVDHIIQNCVHTARKESHPALLKDLKEVVQGFWDIYVGANAIKRKCFTNPALRPALTCEAAFGLLHRLCTVSAGMAPAIAKPPKALMEQLIELTELCSSIADTKALLEVADTARILFQESILPEDMQQTVAEKWLRKAGSAVKANSSQMSPAIGWLVVFSRLFDVLPENARHQVVDLVLTAMKMTTEIGVRVGALESLGYMLNHGMSTDFYGQLHEAVSCCLTDYTTDQRGDVGSLVRVAACRCIGDLQSDWLSSNSEVAWSLLALVSGLSVEKLDRVRLVATDCAGTLTKSVTELQEPKVFQVEDDCSSIAHFLRVVNLAIMHPDKLLVPTLMGLVSSIGLGSEMVLDSSREAVSIKLLSRQSETAIMILEALMKLITNNLNNERLIPPTLTTIAFLFETGSLRQYQTSKDAASTFRSLFVIVQKAHLKSASIPRLLAAADIYTDLVRFTCVRTSALKKLLGFLAHPFPLVRRRTAENLYSITENDSMLAVDWSRPPAKLKDAIEILRAGILKS